jgi:hypothetical protein
MRFKPRKINVYTSIDSEEFLTFMLRACSHKCLSIDKKRPRRLCCLKLCSANNPSGDINCLFGLRTKNSSSIVPVIKSQKSSRIDCRVHWLRAGAETVNTTQPNDSHLSITVNLCFFWLSQRRRQRPKGNCFLDFLLKHHNKVIKCYDGYEDVFLPLGLNSRDEQIWWGTQCKQPMWSGTGWLCGKKASHCARLLLCRRTNDDDRASSKACEMSDIMRLCTPKKSTFFFFSSLENSDRRQKTVQSRHGRQGEHSVTLTDRWNKKIVCLGAETTSCRLQAAFQRLLKQRSLGVFKQHSNRLPRSLVILATPRANCINSHRARRADKTLFQIARQSTEAKS